MKVGFVVQRYGPDVVGGSESLCRQVAERLSAYLDVHVLTTCAREYTEWANYFPAGVTRARGVTIHRFPTTSQRDRRAFDRMSLDLLSCGSCHGFPLQQLEWMQAQGPRADGLLDYIAEHGADYDAFVFFTYLYYTTYFGLQLAPEKSVLVPTAHDEPPIHLELFRSLFHLPRAIIFMTEEERAFVHGKFHNEYIPSTVVGMGIEGAKEADGARFRAEYGLGDTPLLLFAGRVAPSKNCEELFDFFLRYKHETGSAAKLVMLGRVEMPVPEHPDIVMPGFVSDQCKFDAYHAANVVVMPSRFESFSIVSLEAMSVGTPLLANGASAVLREHCARSNGGLFYRSYPEFAGALTVLLQNDSLRQKLGEQGAAYVRQNYQWGHIERQYLEVLHQVTTGGCDAPD